MDLAQCLRESAIKWRSISMPDVEKVAILPGL